MRRYPFASLLEAVPWSEFELSRRIGLTGTSLRRAREHGFSESAADRYACRAGFVPWHIWPEWLDDIIADESIPCEECGTSFVPSRKGHGFCTRNCRARKRKRERYASDPEFAERTKAYQQAYYEECGDYVRSRVRLWREENPDRVRSGRRAYYETHGEQERAKNRERYHARKAAA